MESLAPPLKLLMCVRRAMEKGQSVRQGVLAYLKSPDLEFSADVSLWISLLQQGKETKACLARLSSAHRRVLLQTLERGLKGESIQSALLSLEEELVSACQREIDEKIARLPFILLVPLLLFQFPAFLMLLFGPLLKNFLHSLGGG